MQQVYPSLKEALEKIIECVVTSVTFVEDYIQVSWEMSILTAYTMPTLLVGSTIYSKDDAEYRNMMYGLEGQRIKAVEVNGENDVTLVFVNNNRLSISLRESDYVAAEALLYQEIGGLLWVA